jgi:hypothetical protein
MSKQSEAKASQGYVDKVVPATCGNCASCQPTMSMVLQYVDPQRSELGTHTAPLQTGQACGLGEFKVKKLGWCKEHSPIAQPASEAP